MMSSSFCTMCPFDMICHCYSSRPSYKFFEMFQFLTSSFSTLMPVCALPLLTTIFLFIIKSYTEYNKAKAKSKKNQTITYLPSNLRCGQVHFSLTLRNSHYLGLFCVVFSPMFLRSYGDCLEVKREY